MSGLPELIAGMTPQSVVVLSGAGVFVDGPASLPDGQELTRRVFDAFFAAGALEAVVRQHEDVGWLQVESCPRRGHPVRPRLPRLETVLGVAAQVYGDYAVPAVLADAQDAPPNRLHAFFAGHLARGGRHLTANFDDCIERAADQHHQGWRLAGRLHHFHGCVADDSSGSSLGATLRRVEGGFDSSETAAFTSMLPADGVLLVVGYSGSDFFDVDQVIAALAPDAMAKVRVVWICHSDHNWHLIDPAAVGVPPLARLLRQAGARIEMACGPTGELADELARQWGMADTWPAAARNLRTPLVSGDEESRQKATFHLFRELGLIGEVAALLRSGSLVKVAPAQLWQARSEVLWEQGRWNTLRRMWCAPGVRAVMPAATCAERVGACLWVQGRLLPAYLWLTWHRRRLADPGDALMLAETEGRVIEHMARTPELRPLSRRLAPGMLALLGSTPQAAGIHLYRRRHDLTSSLASVTGRVRAPTEAQTSSRWFAEAGSLLAAMNYRHRQYRDNYRAETVSDAELSDRYRQLQRYFDSIGSPSGRWRVHLLPGAERVFSLAEIGRGILTLQYGWWQRIRILVRYLLHRIRWRLKRI
jgi:hypothetical protein